MALPARDRARMAAALIASRDEGEVSVTVSDDNGMSRDIHTREYWRSAPFFCCCGGVLSGDRGELS